jgi:hypothetical protein
MEIRRIAINGVVDILRATYAEPVPEQLESPESAA